VRRVVVLGGRGTFGAAALERLRAAGPSPLVAARRAPADLLLDADDPAALRAGLRRGDVVLDAAGPWQARTTALVEAAIDVGFDVVDLSDSLGYARRLRALTPRIDAAGIAVLTSCSTVSAISAAVVATSGVASPVRVATCLVPGARTTARKGTAAALLASVGAPIRVLREGRLVRRTGWSESRAFALPAPLGRVRGHLMETADAVLLPRSFPSIARADLYVHTHVPGMDPLLALAARVPPLKDAMSAAASFGTAAARRLGAASGCVAWEVTGSAGDVHRSALVGSGPTYVSAVVPATLAVEDLAHDRFPARGLVLPHLHVDPARLFRSLEALGIRRE
jgi:hypothetical protein